MKMTVLWRGAYTPPWYPSPCALPVDHVPGRTFAVGPDGLIRRGFAAVYGAPKMHPVGLALGQFCCGTKTPPDHPTDRVLPDALDTSIVSNVWVVGLMTSTLSELSGIPKILPPTETPPLQFPEP